MVWQKCWFCFYRAIIKRSFHPHDYITKQLDTGTWLFDPKILVHIEFYDGDGLNLNQKHDIEEHIAVRIRELFQKDLLNNEVDPKKSRLRLLKKWSEAMPYFSGIPGIEVRLEPKLYSATYLDHRGNFVRQIPLRSRVDNSPGSDITFGYTG